MKKHKKYFLFLGILILFSPLGILLPHWLNSGDAWGEWSTKEVKEQTGIQPKGMSDKTYEAPVPDYASGDEQGSLVKRSGNYIFSGLLGAGIIIILTFTAYTLIPRKKKE
jgi:hypothetical protein